MSFGQGDLAGRVAVVTGGARGIGRAISTRFLEQGATVVIADRDLAPAEATAAVRTTTKIMSNELRPR